MHTSDVRFLADENCDIAIVRKLREGGYDVLAVSEYANRSEDRELIQLAHHEGRVVLTEDKDFGWLVFASHTETVGVILLRFPTSARGAMLDAVVGLVRSEGAGLYGAFVVMQPGLVRLKRMP